MKRILFLGLASSLLALGGGCCVIDSPCLPRNRGSFEHCGPSHGGGCRSAVASCDECGGGGCDSCDSSGPTCDEGCGAGMHNHCGPLTWVFSLLKGGCCWCGKECIDRGPGYWGQVDHCDPCDSCGNFTGGGGDCGCNGGEMASNRTHRSYRSQPAAQVISEGEEEDVVSSRPQRPTPAARYGEPRRATRPQYTVDR